MYGIKSFLMFFCIPVQGVWGAVLGRKPTQSMNHLVPNMFLTITTKQFTISPAQLIMSFDFFKMAFSPQAAFSNLPSSASLSLYLFTYLMSGQSCSSLKKDVHLYSYSQANTLWWNSLSYTSYNSLFPFFFHLFRQHAFFLRFAKWFHFTVSSASKLTAVFFLTASL